MVAAGAYVNGSQYGGTNALKAAQDMYNFDLTTGPVIARGGYVLVVEGAIQCAKPVGTGTVAGDYCRIGRMTGTSGPDTMMENVQLLAKRALAVLSVGTCSSFGGVPGAKGNATDARGVLYKGTTRNGALLDPTVVGTTPITNVLGMPIEQATINISGCPPHPDWIVGTIAGIVGQIGTLSTFLQMVKADVDDVLAGSAGLPLVRSSAALKAALPQVTSYARPIDSGYGEYQCNAGPCTWRYNNITQRAKNTDSYGLWTDNSNPYATGPASWTGSWPPAGWTGGPAGTYPPSITYYTGDADFNPRYPTGDSKRLGREKYTGNALGCLGILGCKGRKTKADCSRRRWNTPNAEKYGVNWCVGSRGNCHGCTEPTFPDKVGKFYTFI
jgi:Ni,Fe-hydrogenase I small subunit